MDDFSWTPPSQALQAPPVAPPVPEIPAVPKSPEAPAALDFSMDLLPELASVPVPVPVIAPEPELKPAPEPTVSARRILIDGEEFDVDFTLPAGLEQELMALAAPPVVSPPTKAPVGFGQYSDRFDIGTELQKRPATPNTP